ncbi:MAG: cytochrome c oxidase assembly protein [Gammaproteobacteria bacterium]|nr:cytochrome c oxidase assembly protein [Gammaproteobacteria bacterium]|tara:strand:+ start:522 stop:1070 length:549 start_codon:yes stop_codon:yes gene_type:complete
MSESKRTIRNLCLTVIGMFGFGFLLVPIYDVFCEITGLNGKIEGPSTLSPEAIQEANKRDMLIQFVTHNNESMPWIFKSEASQVKIRTGVQQSVLFVFENTTDKDMVGQVIPSVSPGRGAEYFHKTECFCFEQQKLLAGERVELPVIFIIDPNIPLDIGSLSLGYTLFDITDQFSENQIAAL